MNFVSLLRTEAGVTQRDLAIRAGTSQPTIALYESGSKSPTVATLQRLASALELDLIVTYAPRLTREDQRSLSYHHAIAQKLKNNSSDAIRRAKRNLKRMSKGHQGVARLFDRWRVWLNLPVDELIPRILDPGMIARDMRQVSPFAGILEGRERLRILKRFRKESMS